MTNFVGGWNRKRVDRMISELEPALKEVAIARANCVFHDDFRLNNEGCKKVMEFLQFATIQSQRLEGNLGLFDSIQDSVEKAGSATDEDNKSRLRCVEIVTDEVSDFARESYNLLEWLQNVAALDLIKTAESNEHWWKTLLNFTGKKPGP
jgi:hypothetical protein